MAFEEDGTSLLPEEEQEQTAEGATSLPSQELSYDDPNLIEAHAFVESTNKPTAVGPSTKYGQAKGYLQMLDTTFKRYADKGANIFDKAANITARNRYMKELSDKFGGSLKLALAAYHAGEGNVSKWIKEYGTDDWDVIKSKIEAENPHSAAYPDKVLTAYQKKKDYGSEAETAVTERPVSDLDYPPPTKQSKLDEFLQYNDTVQQAWQAVKTQQTLPKQGTVKDFANRMLPIVTRPEYDLLTQPEKLAVLAQVYSSQNWDPETAAFVKERAEEIRKGMAPDELPEVPSLVTALTGPAPRLDTGTEESTSASVESWKANTIKELRNKGLPPELLGYGLDEYFDEVNTMEKDAAIKRNRSYAGLALNRAKEFARGVAKGGAEPVTSAAAAATRYAVAPFSKEASQAAGDWLSTLPEMLGKPATDYLYKTDESGHLVLDQYGQPISLYTDQVARGIGAIASFMIPGRYLTSLKFVGSAPNAVRMANMGMGGVGTLMAMENGYRESEAAGGNIDQNLTAGLLSAPGGALVSFGLLSMAAGAPPSLVQLNRFNQAKVLSTWMLKNAAEGGVLVGGQQLAQTEAIGQMLGRDIHAKEKTISAVLMGSIGAAAAKAVEIPGTIKADARITADLAKSKLAQEEAVKAEATRLLNLRQSMTDAEWANLQSALEEFQLSPVSSKKLTKEQAERIAIDPHFATILEAMHLTPMPDEAGGFVLTKDTTYLRSPARETLEDVEGLITTVKGLLSKAVSPDGYEGLKQRHADVKNELKVATDAYGQDYISVASQRQKLITDVEKAKATAEQAEIRNDKDAHSIAREDLAIAKQRVADFDAQHEKFYNEGYERIGKLEQERLDIEKRLKAATESETPYLNNIGEMQNDLADLIKLRDEFKAKARNERRRQLAAEKKERQTIEATEEARRQAEIDAAREARANQIIERRLLFNELGMNNVPEAASFERGVNVEGTRLIRSRNNKWYAVDEKGDPISKGYDFFYDAVQASKVGFKDVPATPVTPTSTGITSNAETSSSVLGGGAAQAASRIAAEEGVLARTLPPDADFANLRRVNKPLPGEVLTSNYTALENFAGTGTKPVAASSLFKAAQKIANALLHKTQILVGGSMKKPKRVEGGGVQKTLGFLNFARNVAKVARHDDVQTLSHELTHILERAVIRQGDDQMGDFSHIDPKVIAAVKDQAETFYPAKLSELDKVKEGFANFFEHYFSKQPVRKEILDWYNTTFKNENPSVYKAIEGFKDKMFEYYNQSPSAYMGSRIAEPTTAIGKAYRKISANMFTHTMINRWRVLRDIDPLIEKDYESHYARGGELSSNLIRGIPSDFNGNKLEGPNLIQILDSIKGKGDLFARYLVARRAVSLMSPSRSKESRREVGVAYNEAKKFIREIENSEPNVTKAAEAYYRWLDNVYRVMEQAGPQSQWAVNQMREANLKETGTEHGYWVPFQREGYGYVSSMAPVKGSTRAIMDPLRTIEPAIKRMFEVAIKQRTLSAIMEAATRSPVPFKAGHLIREVVGEQRQGLVKEFKDRSKELFKDATGESESVVEGMAAFLAPEYKGQSGKDFRTYVIMDGKRPRFFEMDPKIIKAMDNSLPDWSQHIGFKTLMNYPAAILRPLATTYNVAFQVRNTARDLSTAWRFIETSGMGANDAIKLVQYYLSSVKDQMLFNAGANKEGWFALFNRLGVTHSTRYAVEKELVRASGSKPTSKVLEFADVSFNKMSDMLSFTENATRAAATRMFLESKFGVKDPNQVLTPFQAAEAIWFYKNVTTNFQRQGSVARVINQWVPFFTARIAEYSRLPGDFKRNPGKMLAIAGTSLAYGFYHALAHKDEDWYQEMQPKQKMQSITFAINHQGVKKVMFIPLDSWSAMSWGIGQAIGHAAMKDPNLKPSFVELAKSYFQGMLPVNHPTEFLGIVGKEALQQTTNKDYYFNRTIVPPNLEYQAAPLQANEMTTELAKRVGERLGWSPLRIDHAIRTALPAAGKFLVFSDKVLGYKKAQENKSANFIINALTRSGGASAVMDRSQELFTEQLLKYRTNKSQETPEEGEIRKALEKLNRHISDAKTVLFAKLDQKDRDEVRKLIKQDLTLGINIGKGKAMPFVTSSALRPQAQTIRKEESSKMRDELLRRKAELGMGGALKGDTED